MNDDATLRLSRLNLSGFKTIRHLPDLELGDITVLIGANGAGKTNLISFFRLLGWMLPPPGKLQLFVGRAGGANSLLHLGAGVTPQVQAELTFRTGQGENQYRFRLFHAAGDKLVFAEEMFRYTPDRLEAPGDWHDLGSGHHEARIIERAERGKTTARTILYLLKQCVVYQFHNTSDTARIRQRWDATDNFFLKEDGANLAPVLLRLMRDKPRYYTRIVETIRQAVPYFEDFQLQEQDGTVFLQWRELHSDMVFGAHLASDGTLRLMALVTLLLLPPGERPSVVLLDEPELGLHPFAVDLVAGLVKAASIHSQVVVATQSPTLINSFAPEHVVVVDREGAESRFQRLDPARLDDWLEDYTLADLWEKNVLGGKPA